MTGPCKALSPTVVIYLSNEFSPLRAKVRGKNFKSSPISLIPMVHLNKDWEPILRSLEEDGGGTGTDGEGGGPYGVNGFVVTR